MNKITYLTGDATEPISPGIICHICNNVGTWGAGFVVALSKKWPEAESAYRRVGKWELGFSQVIPTSDPNIKVCNMIAQKGIGHKNGIPPIRYEALRLCLHKLSLYANQENITDIHMPRIGAGLAGGDWSIIEQIIEEELTGNELNVYVYDLPNTKYKRGL